MPDSRPDARTDRRNTAQTDRAHTEADQHGATKTSPLLLVLVWLVVVAPTAWGLSYTVRNAMKLFGPHTTASASPTPSPGATTPATR